MCNQWSTINGRHGGFIAHLKREVLDLFTIHCVIHRQHLVAKHLSDRLHSTLQAVIRAVNKIKAHSLNDRIFHKLCHENEEEFERPLLHTEVRWLSKGKCLQRFYNLYDSVIDFFKGAILFLKKFVQWFALVLITFKTYKQSPINRILPERARNFLYEYDIHFGLEAFTLRGHNLEKL